MEQRGLCILTEERYNSRCEIQRQTEDTEMSVSVVFPEELLVAAGKDRDQFVRLVMVYTLGQMYRQGQISAGLAARLLGCDRWAFYNL